MKKLHKLFIGFILLAYLMPQGGYAQANGARVKVALPSFPVTLNGTQVDNEHRQYPLIVYKGITYFPMTYYDSRFLGIETKWDREQGLAIDQTGISGAYRDHKEDDPQQGKTWTAAIANIDIQVNGSAIHYSKEQYPFLVFRDVTYFPLTWKYAVEEFGWTYSFDARNGLVIQSSNPQLEEITLPGYTDGSLISAQGHYYYQGADGSILQAPADQSEQVRKVYQLPIWSYGDGDTYVNSFLDVINGEAWLSYHQGGAVMGMDYYIKLNPDGTSEEMDVGYLTMASFGEKTFKVNLGVPPQPNNLMVKDEGQAYHSLGDPAYLYGWDWTVTGEKTGGSPSRLLHLADNHLYLLAFHTEQDTDVSRIHKVDLATGETTRVTDKIAQWFTVDGEHLYFSSGDKLYKMPFSGGEEEPIAITGKLSGEHNVQVLNGTLYYVDSVDGELYAAGADHSLNAKGKVKWMGLVDGYLVSTFAEVEKNSNPYRMIVMDKHGEVIFKTSDEASAISIDSDILTYVEKSSSRVYRVELGQVE